MKLINQWIYFEYENILTNSSPKTDRDLTAFAETVNLLKARTAGMAANSPRAVAINASDIPGATALMVAWVAWISPETH